MNETSPLSAYQHLVERLNRFPQGAPPAEALTQILKILFSAEEAELVSLLPIKPFNAKQASQIWKTDLNSARKTLETLASRAILLDIEQNGESVYVLPPPMAGFFEFSLMRYRNDVDQKLLSELFYQYLTVEDDFMGALIARGETQLGRVFVNETILPEAHVLDYERASEVVKTATYMGIGVCYCRHKARHVNQVCDAPVDEICMTFNGAAESLIKHGFARQVDVSEGLDLLQKAYDHNLVQFGENVRQGVSFICNCCGCCCEAMIAHRKFGASRPIHTSNFIPEIDVQDCNGCGKCVNICPVEAMTLVSTNDPHAPKMKQAKVDEDLCLGCGVCMRVCSRDGIHLHARPERVITPMNTVHRTVMMAIERGGLQDLIFDNRVLLSHRSMAAVLGVILKLSPVKRALANQQVKSRYLEALIERINL